MTDRVPVSKHFVLLCMLQALSEKAKVETKFFQQLEAMGDSSCKYTFG